MPAGRPKGTEGKSRREVRRLLAERYPDYHPALQLAEIAQDSESPRELQAMCAKELLAYLCTKLRAVEVTGEGGGPLRAVLAQEDASL